MKYLDCEEERQAIKKELEYLLQVGISHVDNTVKSPAILNIRFVLHDADAEMEISRLGAAHFHLARFLASDARAKLISHQVEYSKMLVERMPQLIRNVLTFSSTAEMWDYQCGRGALWGWLGGPAKVVFLYPHQVAGDESTPVCRLKAIIGRWEVLESYGVVDRQATYVEGLFLNDVPQPKTGLSCAGKLYTGLMAWSSKAGLPLADNVSEYKDGELVAQWTYEQFIASKSRLGRMLYE